MATKHVVKTQTQLDVDFDCDACGYSGIATVNAEGVGIATSFIGIDRGHAERAASEQSAGEALHHARLTAGLLTCPRCRHRSRAAAFQFMVMTAIGVVLLLAVAVVLLRFAERTRDVLLAGGLTVLAIGMAWRKRRQLRSAETLIVQVRAKPPRAVVVLAKQQRQPARAKEPVPPIASAGPAPAAETTPIPDDGGPRLLR